MADTAGAPIEPDASLYARLGGRLPKPLPAGAKLGFVSAPAGFRLTVETGQRETDAAFLPADQDVMDSPAPQKVTPTAKGFTLEIKKDANLGKAPDALRGVIELSGGRAYEVAAAQGVPVGAKAAQSQAAEAEAPSSSAVDAGAKPLRSDCIPVGWNQRTSAKCFGNTVGECERGQSAGFGEGHWPRVSGRNHSESDAVRVSGAVSEGAGAGELGQ